MTGSGPLVVDRTDSEEEEGVNKQTLVGFERVLQLALLGQVAVRPWLTRYGSMTCFGWPLSLFSLRLLSFNMGTGKKEREVQMR